jgi:hypothetical protein
VSEAPGCLLEGAHYVEVPDCKGPRDGDRLQRLRRQVSLSRVELAPFTAPHDVLRVGDRCGTVETLSESFPDNVVWTDSWLSIAGVGCSLTSVGVGEE